MYASIFLIATALSYVAATVRPLPLSSTIPLKTNPNNPPASTPSNPHPVSTLLPRPPLLQRLPLRRRRAMLRRQLNANPHLRQLPSRLHLRRPMRNQQLRERLLQRPRGAYAPARHHVLQFGAVRGLRGVLCGEFVPDTLVWEFPGELYVGFAVCV
jgi:hypothetical protein